MDAKVIVSQTGQRHAEDPCLEPCAIEKGMRVLGGKWTGSILWHLRDEPVRFNDLARMIGGASKKMIADRLQHLQAHGLVKREVMSTAPVSVQYSLTPDGHKALVVLETLKNWSETHTC